MKPSQYLLNAIVAMASPKLFDAGVQAITAVKDMELHQNAEVWTSIYTGLSIIVNRQTPRHRDVGGALCHPDLLLSAGDHSGSKFLIPDISLTLEYNPGTVVILAGRVLSHAVPGPWEGNRICIAQYMKDKVHNHFHVGRPPLPSMTEYDCIKAHGYRRRVDG
jgi:hypothetical protein